MLNVNVFGAVRAVRGCRDKLTLELVLSWLTWLLLRLVLVLVQLYATVKQVIHGFGRFAACESGLTLVALDIVVDDIDGDGSGRGDGSSPSYACHVNPGTNCATSLGGRGLVSPGKGGGKVTAVLWFAVGFLSGSVLFSLYRRSVRIGMS